jgi:tRNA pseudouridine38-40 synthase
MTRTSGVPEGTIAGSSPRSNRASPPDSPLRKLRLVVEYDGTDFAGWQRQTEQRTVQGTIEDRIAQMLGERVEVRGAGRTDAGVHAAGQVASLSLSSRIPPTGLMRGLNSLLPSDIAIVDAADADDAFDARFSARGKIYRYRIWNHAVRSPLHARASWHCRRPLDLAMMREAAGLLCGEHDFRGFRASDCERLNTVRVIRRFDIAKQGALVEIDVEATAFLKNMVRILAGTLADVGRGRRDLPSVLRALEQGDRSAGGVTAPAAGLTLLRVLY